MLKQFTILLLKIHCLQNAFLLKGTLVTVQTQLLLRMVASQLTCERANLQPRTLYQFPNIRRNTMEFFNCQGGFLTLTFTKVDDRAMCTSWEILNHSDDNRITCIRNFCKRIQANSATHKSSIAAGEIHPQQVQVNATQTYKLTTYIHEKETQLERGCNVKLNRCERHGKQGNKKCYVILENSTQCYAFKYEFNFSFSILETNQKENRESDPEKNSKMYLRPKSSFMWKRGWKV